jgi:hypothetical protein
VSRRQEVEVGLTVRQTSDETGFAKMGSGFTVRRIPFLGLKAHVHMYVYQCVSHSVIRPLHMYSLNEIRDKNCSKTITIAICHKNIKQ